MTKQDLFDAGLKRSFELLDQSNVKRPRVVSTTLRRNSGVYYRDHGGKVLVDLRKCSSLTTNPGGYRWSFPGYKIDRTPYGVVAHEIGHHVDAIFGYPSRRLPRGWNHKRISGYEPNDAESFGETMKLFITNPDMLRSGAPVRYNYVTSLGLRAIDETPWHDVLVAHGANERLITAANNWIKQN